MTIHPISTTTAHHDETDDDAAVLVTNSGVSFSVTGVAAHSRFVPLVPKDWTNASPYHRNSNSNSNSKSHSTSMNTIKSQTATDRIHFLWENAPRRETKAFRDHVQSYNHLPNGTDILDSKWALARLLAHNQQPQEDPTKNNPQLVTCETHCFRGKSGFAQFAHHVGLFEHNHCNDDDEEETRRTTIRRDQHERATDSCSFPDLLHSDEDLQTQLASMSVQAAHPPRPNLWVIKDAGSNGAGGIWVVGPNTTTTTTSALPPLVEGHKYVAQQYVWPMVLYGGRKCHVRVYGLLAHDGRAFVHRQCFLHVANEPFTTTTNTTSTAPENDSSNDNARQDVSEYQDSVHITNCCANSHDATKFAGEICADLLQSRNSNNNDINNSQQNHNANSSSACETPSVQPLGEFFPSICASVATLAQRAMPFLQGGAANGAFEYLGMDFILSYDEHTHQPRAYLLEVNAPPSQDTATGLPHAEALHDAVIRDVLNLMVLPRIAPYPPERPGGWQCVYHPPEPNLRQSTQSTNNTATSAPALRTPSLPSKSAIVNRMKWAIFERKALKADARRYASLDEWSLMARQHFAYFQQHTNTVFLESAGGSQVPRQVTERIKASLEHRHRAVEGAASKKRGQEALLKLAGADSECFQAVLGSNATSLFMVMAQSMQLTSKDEIVLSLENHMANVKPWIQLAHRSGASIRWWDPTFGSPPRSEAQTISTDLASLVTPHTKLVAVSHASNVLGEVRDLQRVAEIVRAQAPGATIVVDGVATFPHMYCKDLNYVDAYVVSCHKAFGPHLGVCFTRRDAPLVEDLGTANFEACEGAVGMVSFLVHQ